jgi:hypothetical protein
MGSLKKILITDEVHPLLCESLEKDGFEVDYRPEITRPKSLRALINMKD